VADLAGLNPDFSGRERELHDVADSRHRQWRHPVAPASMHDPFRL